MEHKRGIGLEVMNGFGWNELGCGRENNGNDMGDESRNF
jgi:hypothetical protein